MHAGVMYKQEHLPCPTCRAGLGRAGPAAGQQPAIYIGRTALHRLPVDRAIIGPSLIPGCSRLRASKQAGPRIRRTYSKGTFNMADARRGSTRSSCICAQRVDNGVHLRRTHCKTDRQPVCNVIRRPETRLQLDVRKETMGNGYT